MSKKLGIRLGADKMTITFYNIILLKFMLNSKNENSF